jgi:cytochrome P450
LWRIAQTRGTNSLLLCDEALFDELFVERRLLGRRYFIISDPDGVRRILIDNFENYHRHWLMRQPIEPGLGTGMLVNDGALWRRHRNLIGPLMDYRSVLPDVPALGWCTTMLADHLAGLPRGEGVDLGDMVGLLLGTSLGRVFAGDEHDIDRMVFRMADFPGSRRLTDYLPWPDRLRPRARKIRQEAQQWYPLLDRLIEERRRPDYDGGKDLLWRLVQARGIDGDTFSDAEIRDEALALALGGIHTTLRPICWLFYLIALYPEAEARLHDELDAALGRHLPTAEELGRLGFLRQLVDETMRLYPPVPMMLRTAADDDIVCGHRIPQGATVIVAPWVIHHHRRLWSDPERFDPERFARGNSAGRSRYAYLPFAVGPRACIAAPLAMMQILLAVAVLARRFRFRLVPGHPIRPSGWTTLRPEGGIKVTVEPR